MKLNILIGSVALFCAGAPLQAQSTPASAIRDAMDFGACAVFAHHSGRDGERDRFLRASSERALAYAQDRFEEGGFEPADVTEAFGPDFLAGYRTAQAVYLAELTLEGSLMRVTDLETAELRIEQVSANAMEFYEQRGCDDRVPE